jgi:hypothetical protein
MTENAVEDGVAQKIWQKIASLLDDYERLIRLDNPIGTL